MKNHKVVVYYDETKQISKTNLQGHILFFIPEELKIDCNSPQTLFDSDPTIYHPQNILVEKIKELREKYSCDRKLHFSKLTGTKWIKEEKIYTELLYVLVDSLRSKRSELFDNPLHCKFAVIYFPKKTNSNYFGIADKKEEEVRNIETLLRILLKGACHYLYDDENIIEITKIIVDGNPRMRSFNKARIIDRLFFEDSYGRTPLRDYVQITDATSIVHLNSQHTNYSINSEEYIHSNLLQAADLILGMITRCCFYDTNSNPNCQCNSFSKKDSLARIFMSALIYKKNRKKGFSNSGHFKSFVFSELQYLNQEIIFKELEMKINQTKITNKQIPLSLNC